METVDPQITAAIINSKAIIAAAIIGGIFLVVAALLPYILRKREFLIPKTQVHDSKSVRKEKKSRKNIYAFFGFNIKDIKGENEGKKIRTIQIFFVAIGVIFVTFSLIKTLIIYSTPIISVTVDENVNKSPNTSNDNSESFIFRNWYTWNDNLKAVQNENTVTFNGMVDNACYVTAQLSQSLRGKTVMLVITNAEKSTFREKRLMKIIVNNTERVIIPRNEAGFIESEYISSDNKTVEFVLPDDFDGKLGFVFYQADLKDLQITATYK